MSQYKAIEKMQGLAQGGKIQLPRNPRCSTFNTFNYFSDGFQPLKSAPFRSNYNHMSANYTFLSVNYNQLNVNYNQLSANYNPLDSQVILLYNKYIINSSYATKQNHQ